MATEADIRALKQRHSQRLLALPGVCGVGVERDHSVGYVLALHVDAAHPPADLPDVLEGFPVRIHPSGPFTPARPANNNVHR